MIDLTIDLYAIALTHEFGPSAYATSSDSGKTRYIMFSNQRLRLCEGRLVKLPEFFSYEEAMFTIEEMPKLVKSLKSSRVLNTAEFARLDIDFIESVSNSLSEIKLSGD